MRRLIPINTFAQGALVAALWVGLWPAIDAFTGGPDMTARETAPEAVAQVPSSCCEDLTPTTGCACCDLGCVETGDLACSRSAGAPQCHCSSTGGQIFLATAWATADLDLIQVGRVDLSSQAGLSRVIQPPVPPPLSRLPING